MDSLDLIKTSVSSPINTTAKYAIVMDFETENILLDKSANAKRITYGKGNYATPVWSPRGDYIAFTKSYKKKFFIGLINSNGKGERLISEGYLTEGPTWSPNGRVLSFYSQAKLSDGKITAPKIKLIDLTGVNLRELITPSDASDPAWSSLLP